MPENTPPQVIAGVSDLLFTSKISETARLLRISIGFAGSREALFRKASQAPRLIILDLNLKPLDPVALIRDLKGNPDLAEVPITAFVNHECADLIEAARQAGCDEVLTRGAFSSGLPKILGGVAGRPQAAPA